MSLTHKAFWTCQKILCEVISTLVRFELGHNPNECKKKNEYEMAKSDPYKTKIKLITEMGCLLWMYQAMIASKRSAMKSQCAIATIIFSVRAFIAIIILSPFLCLFAKLNAFAIDTLYCETGE